MFQNDFTACVHPWLTVSTNDTLITWPHILVVAHSTSLLRLCELCVAPHHCPQCQPPRSLQDVCGPSSSWLPAAPTSLEFGSRVWPLIVMVTHSTNLLGLCKPCVSMQVGIVTPASDQPLLRPASSEPPHLNQSSSPELLLAGYFTSSMSGIDCLRHTHLQ